MHPEVSRNSDGSITLSVTLPAADGSASLLKIEEQIMDALNVLGREAVRHSLGGFDTDGTPVIREQGKWTSKGKVLKIYETSWGEVSFERHLYQTSAGGATWCPFEERARIVGGTATPHLARSLSHKYANANARAVARDLLENHGRKLAPSYVADIAAAVAEAASAPALEANAHAPQSARHQVDTVALGIDGTCALFCEEGFKQCMVGTITLYDAQGERLETIYLAQAPQSGKTEFLERLDREWNRVLARYPDAHTVALSDGARDYEPWLNARTTWQILDFYHASGYLGAAAPGMHRGRQARQQWLDDACHALKHETGSARRLADEITARLQDPRCPDTVAPALEAATTYF
jgi:hypothetical protein